MSSDPYVTGLRMLARRELSESQLRSRLVRRQFDPEAIDQAIAKLQQEHALDDRRTARACARDAVNLKRHGRRRVLRQITALGISNDEARAAVKDVFDEVDEDVLMTQALQKRLQHEPALDAAGMRRMYRYLINQGFEPARVSALLRRTHNLSPEP